jgi:hypothetical protein
MTGHRDQSTVQADLLALRRQVQVLERKIKRVRWSPGDRMIMAALREDPVGTSGQVICEQRLGGLLREYSNAPMPAAAELVSPDVRNDQLVALTNLCDRQAVGR